MLCVAMMMVFSSMVIRFFMTMIFMLAEAMVVMTMTVTMIVVVTVIMVAMTASEDPLFAVMPSHVS